MSFQLFLARYRDNFCATNHCLSKIQYMYNQTVNIEFGFCDVVAWIIKATVSVIIVLI